MRVERVMPQLVQANFLDSHVQTLPVSLFYKLSGDTLCPSKVHRPYLPDTSHTLTRATFRSARRTYSHLLDTGGQVRIHILNAFDAHHATNVRLSLLPHLIQQNEPDSLPLYVPCRLRRIPPFSIALDMHSRISPELPGFARGCPNNPVNAERKQLSGTSSTLLG
jgi:hypothetical protein